MHTLARLYNIPLSYFRFVIIAGMVVLVCLEVLCP